MAETTQCIVDDSIQKIPRRVAGSFLFRTPSLRNFFEVDRYYVAIAALKSLADEESIPASTVAAAIKKYGIDPEKPSPVTV